MNDRVMVTSMVSGRIGLVLPRLHINKVWPKKGTKLPVEKEVLREAIYEPGVEYMFKQGLLYIDDMDFKIELGLEPEDATEPVNIIVLSDRDKRYYLTQLSLVGFKDKVKKLSRAQLEELCDYAIQNRLIDIEKDEILQKVCGRDIVAAIRLEKQDQEG